MAEVQKKPAYDDTDPHGPHGAEAAPQEAAPGLEEEPATYDAPTEADVIAELQAERDALRDRLMRALADAENTRKRAEKDRRDGMLYGGARLARDLLPVHDGMVRALDAVTDDGRAAASGLVEGVELTLRELLNILARHGVQRISPAVGDAFDPHQHEAMFEAPVPGTTAGQIIQVMAEGFRLHEQLLGPAQVGVSSTPAS